MTAALNFFSIFPQVIMLSMVVVILMLDCFCKRTNIIEINYRLTIATLLWIALMMVPTFGDFAITTFIGSITRYWDDQVQRFAFSDLLIIVGLVSTALGLLYSRSVLEVNNLFKTEFFVLILLAMGGGMVLITAATLLGIYLGLELMSLSMVALVAFDRKNSKASEAAMKYFIMGAMASGLLLYGMGLIYGATQSLYLSDIFIKLNEFSSLGAASQALLSMALILLLAGVAFKLGAVPFHSWVPDVYEGAPTPVVSFISSVPKLATVAMGIALFTMAAEGQIENWQPVMQMIVFLSFAIGNLVALKQTNIKRMLAYSAISHAGFVLLGLASGLTIGASTAVFYIVTYALTSIAGFGLLMLIQKDQEEVCTIAALKGLFKAQPWLGAMFAIVMFSMAGIPSTVGFYAKFAVLKTAIDHGLVLISLAGLVLSVVGAFYYLRVIKIVCFDEAEKPLDLPVMDKLTFYVLSFNVVLIIFFGVFPSYLMDLCAVIFRP